ncbi:MAG: hypothetical protein AAFY72_19080 [Cyanobacteria bacterium J06649_4]
MSTISILKALSTGQIGRGCLQKPSKLEQSAHNKPGNMSSSPQKNQNERRFLPESWVLKLGLRISCSDKYLSPDKIGLKRTKVVPGIGLFLTKSFVALGLFQLKSVCRSLSDE